MDEKDFDGLDIRPGDLIKVRWAGEQPYFYTVVQKVTENSYGKTVLGYWENTEEGAVLQKDNERGGEHSVSSFSSVVVVRYKDDRYKPADKKKDRFESVLEGL